MKTREMRRKLLTALSDLYILQDMLEHAVRAGVPPDVRHVVQLDSIAKQIASVLTKLEPPSDTDLAETA